MVLSLRPPRSHIGFQANSSICSKRQNPPGPKSGGSCSAQNYLRGPGAARTSLLSGQCLQGSGQTALVAGCFVLVDDLLVSDAVDGRHGLLEDGGCSGLVASLDGLADCLDCGTQGRTLRRVVRVLLN